MSFLPQPCCPPEPDPGCACASAVADVSRLAASATAVTALAANLLRTGAIFWNDSSAACFLKFGAAASATSFTWRLSSQAGYEMPDPIFLGQITVIWESATGALQITELT